MKWIMGLLCPIIFIVIATVILIAKPKHNSLFGYRTNKSLSSDEIWNYANKVMAISLIAINAAICIPVVCIVNAFVKDTLPIVFTALSTAMLGLVATAIITQVSINKKFK